jgi:hypothetical protein
LAFDLIIGAVLIISMALELFVAFFAAIEFRSLEKA